MKIEKTNINFNRVKNITDIKDGTVFDYLSRIYMKIDNCSNNVVLLETGKTYFFSFDTNVYVIENAVLKI